MLRALVGVIAVCLCATARAEDKPTKAADELKRLQGEFEKVVAELRKEIQAAKSVEERQEIIKKKDPSPKYHAQFYTLAEKNPKDPAAINALLMALRTSGRDRGPNSNWDKSLALLTKDHAKSEGVLPLVRGLGGLGDEATLTFLNTVLESNPTRKVQGSAAKSLSASYKQAKKTTEQEKIDKLLKDKFADVFPDLSEGKVAPEVVSQNLDGKKVKLSDLRGKVVVLDIWATWCPPCRAMIPHEREMVKSLEGKPFVLVSISADAKKETLTDFIKKEPMPWTHWWNGESGGIIEDWDVQSFPTIYILDAKGVIRFKNKRGKAMEDAVETLLKEMEAEKK